MSNLVQLDQRLKELEERVNVLEEKNASDKSAELLDDTSDDATADDATATDGATTENTPKPRRSRAKTN